MILVTAMIPTQFGEGKTVTAIGLGMSLSKLGHRAVVCLRQPSLGPVFEVKGGAAGGGMSTVEPIVVMPGLPKVPAAENIQLSDDGIVSDVC